MSPANPDAIRKKVCKKIGTARGSEWLVGDLDIPSRESRAIRAIILFAHGSGSNRKSERNVKVAEKLREAGFATLLVDLLAKGEQTRDKEERYNLENAYRLENLRHDIGIHVQRLAAVTAWVTEYTRTRGFQVGYFGSSTGAAVALSAANLRPGTVRAIVSRGGRPDLVEPILLGNPTRCNVSPPTLLIVGGKDDAVIKLNSNSFETLAAQEKRLVIIPGATHLFDEPPGALDEVARLAINWFRRYLTPAVA